MSMISPLTGRAYYSEKLRQAAFHTQRRRNSLQHYAWSYLGIGLAVLALVGGTVWWVYAKYSRKAN
jgi:hypothetical protein